MRPGEGSQFRVTSRTGLRLAGPVGGVPVRPRRTHAPINHQMGDRLAVAHFSSGRLGARPPPPVGRGLAAAPAARGPERGAKGAVASESVPLREVQRGFDLERMEQSLYVRLNGSHSGRASLRDLAQDDSRGADNPTGPVRVRRVRGGAAPDPLQAHLPPVRVHPRLLRPLMWWLVMSD
jgi:hypothetical protein